MTVSAQRFSLQRRAFVAIAAAFAPGAAWAACSNPDGRRGRTVLGDNGLALCNGTEWQTVATTETVLKAGEMRLTAALSIPEGWLLADGSAVSRTTYSRLFAAISTAFGDGDGVTTFNLPRKPDQIVSPANGSALETVAYPTPTPVLDGSGNPLLDADGNPLTQTVYTNMQIPVARMRWIIRC